MIDLLRRLTPRSLRNWVRQPRRSVRYVFDRVTHACGGTDKVELRPDWSVRCHPASRDHFAVFTRDPAQRAELEAFIQHCVPEMQFLDIGAHYGLFALAAAHFGGAAAKIVSVEASSKAATILKSNLAANHVLDQNTVLEVAMGATDGTLEMLSTGPAGSDYFVSAPIGRSDTISVPQMSLTSAIRATGLKPTHIKMDIEGFEADVIPAAVEYLREHRPLLFLELHGPFIRARGKNPVDVIAALRACGYKRFEVDGRCLSDEEISARGHEIRAVVIPS